MKKLLIAMIVLDEEGDAVETHSLTIPLKTNYEKVYLETSIYQSTDRVFNDVRFVETVHYTDAVQL